MTTLLNRDKDTICALASAQGLAGISVVRVSGPQAIEVVQKVCPFLPRSPESHRVYYGKLKSQSQNIDEVLVSYFARGRSFTGEDTLEISLHGSPVLVSQCLDLLVKAGGRLAERGEFTFRAFMNGRIDLVQAESVLELIQSQSRKAAQVSLRQLEGHFSSQLAEIKREVTGVLAHLEANIDFASEDIEIASKDHLVSGVTRVQSHLKALLDQHQTGKILKSGYQVVLVGRPNVGKSSLLNALLEEEKAIVTPIEGTTRDLIEGRIFIEGYQVDLTDTAGLRESADEIEVMGQSRAREKLIQADLIFLILDAQQVNHPEDAKLLQSLPKEKTIVITNKMDLKGSVQSEAQVRPELRISAKTGEGLSELRQIVLKRLLSELAPESDAVSMNSRHFGHLKRAEELLVDSLTLLVNDESPDLVALELHSALREIFSVLGEVYDDQVMDQVFNQFCIGK